MEMNNVLPLCNKKEKKNVKLCQLDLVPISSKTAISNLFSLKLCVTEKRTEQFEIPYLLTFLLSMPLNKLRCFSDLVVILLKPNILN